MNRTQFISFIDAPDKLSSADAVLLSGLINNFPYFQTAHLLYAKSLHNQHSIHYNNQLKITAAYATDRRMLHRLITKQSEAETTIVRSSPIQIQLEDKKLEQAVIQIVKEEVQEQVIQPVFIETPVERVEIPPIVEAEERVIEKIEETIRQEKEAVEQKADAGLELEKEYLSEALNARVELEVLHTEPLIEEQPETVESDFVLNTNTGSETKSAPQEERAADFDTDQPHSFDEWLKHTSVITSKTEENTGKPMTAADLIDKFIREEPKIAKPKAFFNPVNMAKQSVAEDITFVSETLAKIYVLQGNYSKALDAYENLRLKYPEKRLYFAAQIKNLRKLINQQNNK